MERGFGYAKPRGKRRGRDFFAFGRFQHRGERLQDVHAALAGLQALRARDGRRSSGFVFG